MSSAPARSAFGAKAAAGKRPAPSSVTAVLLSLVATYVVHSLVSRSRAAAQEAEHALSALAQAQAEVGELRGALAAAQTHADGLASELAAARQAASAAVAAAAAHSCPVCAPCACAPCVRAAAAPAEGSGDAPPAPDVFPTSARGPAALGAVSPPWSGGPSRGLYEDRDARSLVLPPDYCDLRKAGADQDGVPAPATSRFERLDPASIAIDAEGKCHWAALRAWAERPTTEMCTHDPATDGHVSQALHQVGTWLKVDTELPAFSAVACTPERPFMLDIGSNIGSFSVIAAAKGCHVILVDPMTENLGRAVESIRRMGALRNATFYRVSGAAWVAAWGVGAGSVDGCLRRRPPLYAHPPPLNALH